VAGEFVGDLGAFVILPNVLYSVARSLYALTRIFDFASFMA